MELKKSVSPHGSLARGNTCNLGFQTLQWTEVGVNRFTLGLTWQCVQVCVCVWCMDSNRGIGLTDPRPSIAELGVTCVDVV